jgi:tetratricopeptide (TPR) repeat protein
LTTQTEHSPSFSDETLAAYVDGRLDEATRKRVVEHVADCAECLEVVQVNQEMSVAAPAAQVIQWPRNLIVPLAAAAVIGAVVMLTPVRDMVLPHDDLGALAKVAPPKRWFEGRLTRFPYQEFHRERGGVNDPNKSDIDTESLALQIAAGEAQKHAMDHPNARTLHAEGVAYLALHDAKHAVETLQQARDLSPNDPQVLSDLAAAYIETQQYELALDSANRAYSMAKKAEIAWNRAMAAQRAGRLNEAIAAWNDYLKIGDSPQWIQEAQGRLADAREALQTQSK